MAAKPKSSKEMDTRKTIDSTDVSAFGKGSGIGTGTATGSSDASTENESCEHIAYSSNSYQKYATKMLTDRAFSEYKRHKNRGIALIFNQEQFNTQDPRKGTNADCKQLTQELQKLEFDVRVYQDYQYFQILRVLEEISAMNHEDNDCILVTILSHGNKGFIYAKDLEYKIDVIWSYFTDKRCPSLAGKPKLFFIQACQGAGVDPGITLQHNRIETDCDSTTSFKVPNQTDFLIAYATMPGFYAWRNESGSWFIRSLCYELAANGKQLDLLTLLTFVCQRVAINFESFTPGRPELDQQKQMPCITNTLTRILIFRDKK